MSDIRRLLGMPKTFFTSGVSMSAMKRSVSGGINLTYYSRLKSAERGSTGCGAARLEVES